MHDPTHAATTADRRQFLRIGGAGALAAAFLAACGSDESPPPAETGVTDSTTTTIAPAQTTLPEEGAAQGVTIARTLRSAELAAVTSYDVLLGGTEGELALPAPIAYQADVTTALEFLRGRHQAHADALVQVIDGTGGSPVEEANAGVLEGVVAPQLAATSTEATAIRVAVAIEDVLAGTYAWGATSVPGAELRAELMTLGGPTARQAAAARLLQQPNGVNVVSSALFDISGPARLPEHMLLSDDEQDGGDISPEAPVGGGEEEAEGEEEETPGVEGEDRETPAEGEGGEGAEPGTTDTTEAGG